MPVAMRAEILIKNVNKSINTSVYSAVRRTDQAAKISKFLIKEISIKATKSDTKESIGKFSARKSHLCAATRLDRVDITYTTTNYNLEADLYDKNLWQAVSRYMCVNITVARFVVRTTSTVRRYLSEKKVKNNHRPAAHGIKFLRGSPSKPLAWTIKWSTKGRGGKINRCARWVLTKQATVSYHIIQHTESLSSIILRQD